MAVIRYARQHGTKRLWLAHLMGRRPTKVAAVALANKIVRMARPLSTPVSLNSLADGLGRSLWAAIADTICVRAIMVLSAAIPAGS